MGSSNSIFDESKSVRIGSGIYGEVKRATYTPKNVRAAIKIIDLDGYFNIIRQNNQQRNNYIDSIKQRISEMKILEGNNYQNVNFNKYFEETDLENNKLNFAMELCNCNLLQYFEDYKINKGLDIGEIYDILNQLNNTFQIMSSQNIKIIHGNLKLENILVNFEENKKIFKLTGFEIIPELVKLTKLYKQDNICKYLPPEILRSNNFTMDQKNDIWSLGVIIYFLYFGEFPYKGETCMEVLRDIRTKTEKKTTNFKELDDLIDGLLKFDKEERLTWEEYFDHPFFTINGFWRRYNIVNKIGEGELSTVYKAISKENNENEVAIKLIDFSKIENLEKSINERDDMIKEIKERIEKTKRLSNDYPNNFIRIDEQFDMDKGIAFSMELCDTNLKEYINNIPETNASSIFFFLVELNKTFKILLKENIIIGNLKLDNILLKKQNNSSDYIYKLSDIGLCPKLMKIIKDCSKTENLFYLPPELYDQNNYEKNSDLWNLGVIINYYRYKQFPYEGKSFEEIINQIKSGQKRIRSSKNEEFNLLLGGLLERVPDKRLNWDDYFHHSFFTNRQYTEYYELLGDPLPSLEGGYYSIYIGKEIKCGEERMIKIINKDKIRDRYYLENLKHIDGEKIKALVNHLIKQTEVMKILEEGNNVNTIKFFEYFDTQKEFVSIMEKCEDNLSHYFNYRKENFNLEEITDLLMQLNNTFKIMAKNNIIHGDLKLENIFFKKIKDNKFVYKLTNYGVSKEFLKLAEIFFHKGKPEYLAPEVLSGEDLNIQSDLWSLGVVLYTLFFRTEPYKGKNNIEVLKSINSQNKFKSSGNPEFDHLIRKLLTVDIKDRLTWDQYFDHPFLFKGDCWKYYTDKEFIRKILYFKIYKAKLRDRNETRCIKVIDLNAIKIAIEDMNHRPCTDDDLKIYIDDFIKLTEDMELLRGPNKDNINTLIFYEYFLTKNEFCIVQELCDGNLGHLLRKKNRFKVKEIYEILKQLNNTFHIFKDNNFSHKNLRLDNILIKKKDKEDGYIYKIAGFEIDRKIKDLFGRGGIVENEKFKAPEILSSEFSGQNLSTEEMNLIYQKADLWSLGIIIFILYFGVFPYEGNNSKEIYSNILKNEKARLNEINDLELKDLLKKLLTEDKDERIDWDGYFKHKFFSGEKWT